MAARNMHWTYLIVLFVVSVVAVAVVAAVTFAPARRMRTATRAARHPVLREVSLLDAEEPPTCIACGCPVADEETHWKAIHHVPA